MGKGKGLTEQRIDDIMIDYILNNTGNCSATARAVGMPITTVIKVVKEHIDDDRYNEIKERKRVEFDLKFIACADRIIGKALGAIEHKIDTDDKIQLSQLATTLGIVMDKKALITGQSTGRIEIKLPPGSEEYAV